jgi:opacity protein-like surface antigen
MKKQLLLLVLFIGLFSAVNAQDKKMMLGLDLNFSSNDNESSFGIGPNFGYWLSENMALVVGVNFGSVTDKTGAEDLATTSFGAGAELRYGWHVGDMTFLYVAPGFAFGSTTHEITPTTEAKVSSFDVGLGLGVQYMIADSWSINAEFGRLGYNSVKPEGGESFGTFGLDLSMSTIGFGIWYHF